MTRSKTVATALAFLLSFTVTVIGQKKNSQKVDEARKETKKSRDLENSNRALLKWVDEDVAYIITDDEETAFNRVLGTP